MAEARRSAVLASKGTNQPVSLGLMRMKYAIGRRICVGNGLHTNIGSSGPLVGLFGTVWGIMRTFVGIANSNTTNAAGVARPHCRSAAGNRY